MSTKRNHMTPETAARFARSVFENQLPSSPFDRSAVSAWHVYELVSEISNSEGAKVAEAIEQIMPELFADYWCEELDREQREGVHDANA